MSTRGGPGFTLHFLDVEAAEAIVLRSNRTGETLLIDGGEFSSMLTQRLAQAGILRVDALLPTHWHENHTRAQLWALDSFDIRHFYWNGDTGNNPIFQQVVDKAKAKPGMAMTVLKRGDSFTLGDLTIRVTHPSSKTGDANTDSLALLVSCGSVNVWLAGDTTEISEHNILAAKAATPVNILKLGHHGSADATSQPFLDALKPEVAIYSWGRHSTSIPGTDVIARLKAANVTVYGTDLSDKNDTITFTSDCQSYKVNR